MDRRCEEPIKAGGGLRNFELSPTLWHASLTLHFLPLSARASRYDWRAPVAIGVPMALAGHEGVNSTFATIPTPWEPEVGHTQVT